MINAGDSYIYGYEVEKRIAELEDEKAELDDEEEFADDDELNELKSLNDQCTGYDDWPNGQLIADSEMRTYAEQLADELGMLSRSDEWPMRHIDWGAAADELKNDYASVTFYDYEYWIRA